MMAQNGILPNFTRPLLAAKRFPLALLCAVAAAFVVLVDEHDWQIVGLPDSVFWSKHAAEIFATLVAGYFLFVSVHLLIEFGQRYIGLAVAILGLALLGCLLAFSQHGLFFAMPGTLLLAMAAPFLPLQASNAVVWNCNHQALIGGFFSLLAGFLLTMAVYILYWVLRELFDIPRLDFIFSDVPAMAFCILAGWLTLGFMPSRQSAIAEMRPGRAVAFIASYILVPFIIIYTLVLYAYAAKIAAAGELPRGVLVNIVGWFIGAGIATYLVAYPLRDEGPVWVRLFQRWFFPAVILPSGLLLWSISIRIADKGLTESRYAVVAFGLWALAMALLFSIRTASSIRWLPASLSVILLLASFGPWGAEQLSVRSQFHRMESWLIENGLLVEGKARIGAATLSRGDVLVLQDYADFLIKRGEAARMQVWFEGSAMTPDFSDAAATAKSFGLE